MTVKMTEIKIGDTVLIEAKVINFSRYDLRVLTKVTEDKTSVLDIEREHIKQHIPKPFDWKDVKKGMAFYKSANNLIYYLCECPKNTCSFIGAEIGNYGYLINGASYRKDDYKESHVPEHDKEW